MLAAGDLRFLSSWCDRHGLRWSPGSSEQPYILLERRAGSRPWRRKVLHGGATTLHLLDEADVLLAEASTLPALLDAVDTDPAGQAVHDGFPPAPVT